MTLPRTCIFLLALLCAAGIVGMLVTDGAGDWLFLALAAMPLLLGGAMILWRRKQAAIAKPASAPKGLGGR